MRSSTMVFVVFFTVLAGAAAGAIHQVVDQAVVTTIAQLGK